MQLSNTDLICAAQSDGESSQHAKNEVPIRFGTLLRFLADHARKLYGLDVTETDDIIQLALLALCYPKGVRFDPTRADGYEPYLRGLVQNAARTHARFLRQGNAKRHDYSHPDNHRRNLPVSADEVRDPYDNQAGIETRELAGAVLVMAGTDERALIDRVFYRGEAVEGVAISLKVDRSTVSRRLTRFYRRVLSRGWLFCAADQRCPRAVRFSKLGKPGVAQLTPSPARWEVGQNISDNRTALAEIGSRLDNETTGEHVVQCLLLLGERGHDVTDEQDHTGKNLAKVPARPLAKADPPPAHVRDLDPHGHFAECGLVGRGFHQGEVEPTKQDSGWVTHKYG